MWPVGGGLTFMFVKRMNERTSIKVNLLDNIFVKAEL